MIKTHEKTKYFVTKNFLEEFVIPADIKNDIIYCQVFLRHYIKVHQVWLQYLQSNPNDSLAKKCFSNLEKDIWDIGNEQKVVVSKLRLFANEYYGQFMKAGDMERNSHIKEYGDAAITKDLYNTYVYVNLAQINRQKILLPKNVTPRKTAKELLLEFRTKTLNEGLPSQLNNATSMETPLDLPNPTYQTKKYSKSNILMKILEKSEETLNSERHLENDIKTEEQDPSPPRSASAISSSRMNLLNALNKARTQRLETTCVTPNKSPASSNNSSPVSSGSTTPVRREPSPELKPNFVIEKLPSEPEEPVELSKESFLTVLGLCTIERSMEIRTKRRERRRRNVTSTEKLDFHYGRFEFFEPKPLAMKRKKPILYSPPATRALKKRKQSDDNDNMLTSKSKTCLGNITTDNINTCNFCLVITGEKLNKCEKCLQSFHIKCHKNVFSAQSLRSRESICPDCYRLQQKQAAALLSHSRDLKNREKLIKKFNNLKNDKEKLLVKYEILENKLYENVEVKTNLMYDELFVQNRMKKLCSVIGELKGLKD